MRTLVYFIMSIKILLPNPRSGTGSWIHLNRLTGILPGSSFFSGMAAQAVSQSPFDRASAAISPWPEHLHSQC